MDEEKSYKYDRHEDAISVASTLSNALQRITNIRNELLKSDKEDVAIHNMDDIDKPMLDVILNMEEMITKIAEQNDIGYSEAFIAEYNFNRRIEAIKQQMDFVMRHSMYGINPTYPPTNVPVPDPKTNE